MASQTLSRRPRRHKPTVERLEERVLLATGPLVGTDGSVTITLDDVFDQFGFQPVGIHAYGDRAAFSIVDTGASVITFSHFDQFLFKLANDPIPIKVPNGAEAQGIGGTIIGDVSEPGVIRADGLHIATLTFDEWGFPEFQFEFDESSATLEGVQVMVGNPENSQFLPTVTGTPMLLPSDTNPEGLALRIDTQGYLLDFSDLLPGVVIPMPDVRFVSPDTELVASDNSIDPVVIPIDLLGQTNHPEPGMAVTEAPNPIIVGVDLAEGDATVEDQTFLFDTGAMLSVISTQAAIELGLDLSDPEFEIDVMGAAGVAVEVGGFIIDELSVPLANGAELTYRNVPVFVLDVAEGLVDGLFGTNLMNPAETVLYNPNHADGPRVEMTFFRERFLEGGDVDPSALALLSSVSPVLAGALGGPQLPTFSRPQMNAPETPPTLDEWEPNNRPKDAGWLEQTFYTSVDGLTGSRDDIDWYRFRAATRSLATVAINMAGPDPTARAFVRVRDVQARQWVAAGYDRVDFWTRPGHTYLVRVRVRSAEPQWYSLHAQQGVRLRDGVLTLVGTHGADQMVVGQIGPDIWVINQLSYSEETFARFFNESSVERIRAVGRDGDDRIELLSSVLVDAVLSGGAGNDRIIGGAGADRLRGGGGDDFLDGGPGDDRLFGDRGDDQLRGGPGADALYGGPGIDELWYDVEDLIVSIGRDGGRTHGG